MRLRDLTAGFLALSLATTPVLAQSASADASRASAPVASANEIGGGNAVIAIIGAVIWGLFIFLVIDDDDNPDSP
jgi:hypothetical protein